MPLAVEDTMEPLGELDAVALFPADDITAVKVRLQAYLDRAYTELDTNAPLLAPAVADRAALVYTYARSYRAVFQRLTAAPIRKSLSDQGSLMYDKQQHNVFSSLAKQFMDEYNQILESAISPLTEPNVIAHTTAIDTEYSW